MSEAFSPSSPASDEPARRTSYPFASLPVGMSFQRPLAGLNLLSLRVMARRARTDTKRYVVVVHEAYGVVEVACKAVVVPAVTTAPIAAAAAAAAPTLPPQAWMSAVLPPVPVTTLPRSWVTPDVSE